MRRLRRLRRILRAWNFVNIQAVTNSTFCCYPTTDVLLQQDGGVLQQPPADQGAAEQPATEGTQPATVEEGPVPPCLEGQVLDEESGLCVLEEPEAAEEPPAEEEQPSEDSGSEDNSNN